MHPDNCKHFNGMHNTCCKLGIAYASFGWNRAGSSAGLPCLTHDTREKIPCASFVLPTAEELRDAATATREAIDALIAQAIARKQRGECLECGRLLTGKRQVGRCIYAKPCGCRLVQGQLRDAQGKAVNSINYSREEPG